MWYLMSGLDKLSVLDVVDKWLLGEFVEQIEENLSWFSSYVHADMLLQAFEKAGFLSNERGNDLVKTHKGMLTSLYMQCETNRYKFTSV